jgi:hypothetical protein
MFTLNKEAFVEKKKYYVVIQGESGSGYFIASPLYNSEELEFIQAKDSYGKNWKQVQVTEKEFFLGCDYWEVVTLTVEE